MSVKTEAHSHPIIVSPNHGTSFMSPFWCPEFGGGSYIFGKKSVPLEVDFHSKQHKRIQQLLWLWRVGAEARRTRGEGLSMPKCSTKNFTHLSSTTSGWLQCIRSNVYRVAGYPGRTGRTASKTLQQYPTNGLFSFVLFSWYLRLYLVVFWG